MQPVNYGRYAPGITPPYKFLWDYGDHRHSNVSSAGVSVYRGRESVIEH